MNIHSFSNNSNGREGNGSLNDSAKLYWSNVPLFTRFIVYTSITIYIMSWIMISIVLLFCNIPYYTLYEFRIWTLVTTVFVNLNILTLLFALWSWIDISMKLENRNGTMHFILNFFTLNLIIQSIYLTMTIFLSFLFPSVFRQYSAGLWPLIMSLITIECLINPEADYSFFFFPVKAKFYPWFLLLFFTILNQFMIQIDVLAGILLGYLSFYYIGRFIEISFTTALSFERLFLFSWMKSFTCNSL